MPSIKSRATITPFASDSSISSCRQESLTDVSDSESGSAVTESLGTSTASFIAAGDGALAGVKRIFLKEMGRHALQGFIHDLPRRQFIYFGDPAAGRSPFCPCLIFIPENDNGIKGYFLSPNGPVGVSLTAILMGDIDIDRTGGCRKYNGDHGS
jgi:hypothetical protein